MGISETHGTDGTELGARLVPGCRPFWSHGTRSQAGVWLFVKSSFLMKFNPVRPEDWVPLEAGRAAKLFLRGPSGALDIIVVYLTSGSDQTIRATRRATMTSIAQHVAPREQVLIVMLVDFNFVVDRRDRWSKSDGSWSGDSDARDARAFEILFSTLFGFHELRQPLVTHECGVAKSRLDRACANNSLADQLDRCYKSCFRLRQ
ncbi:unnamed protein product [Prorocentrum cordatum]|uniref:Uncharacterized protein n=1 Tax=Prorocentrum cordatum TaxID=2364126 RepID=A0ABN9XTJ5_9DINO|nr:unnamed protein product [Polarella glacialis]